MDRALMYALVILTVVIPLVMARQVTRGRLPVRRALALTVYGSTAAIGSWLLAVWLLVPRLM